MPGSSLPIQTGQLSAAKVSLTPRRLPTSLAEFCARAIRALENQFVICIEVRLPAVSIVRQPKPVALGALGNQADLLGAHDRILKAPIIPWPQPTRESRPASCWITAARPGGSPRARFRRPLHGPRVPMGKQVGGRECGQALLQCAASCELALQEYASGFGLPVEHELFRVLIPAIATVRTAADVLDEQAKAELALHLAHDACSRAASECRRYGLDEALLRCAAACDLALIEIELLLTAFAHD